MPNSKKHFIREPEKKQKRKYCEPSGKNVISLRLSDDERQHLERIARASSKSHIDIMREALALWMANRRRLCLDS
ncbi:MAG: transcriptional regulator, CopG family [Geobacteraceae bacterium]|nr:transcriptional regulator, CopG family [Geobacteraceae bacterium]